jgi:hypothetical protein
MSINNVFIILAVRLEEAISLQYCTLFCHGSNAPKVRLGKAINIDET